MVKFLHIRNNPEHKCRGTKTRDPPKAYRAAISNCTRQRTTGRVTPHHPRQQNCPDYTGSRVVKALHMRSKLGPRPPLHLAIPWLLSFFFFPQKKDDPPPRGTVEPSEAPAPRDVTVPTPEHPPRGTSSVNHPEGSVNVGGASKPIPQPASPPQNDQPKTRNIQVGRQGTALHRSRGPERPHNPRRGK